MKKSNFNLGDKKGSAVATSNQINFQKPPEGTRQTSIDAKTKADLRSSHWTMGGYGPTLFST
jgi:hypothetical protein